MKIRTVWLSKVLVPVSRSAERMLVRLGLVAGLAAIALAGDVSAQSGPTCQTATPISGVGAGWEFHGSGSTVLASHGCGQTVSHTDSYYLWTAEEDGDYEFVMYSGEAYSHYEIYRGSGCLGPYVTCEGFTLNVTNRKSIVSNVQAGDQFVIRGVFIFGLMQITRSGTGCEGVGDDPFTDNQSCSTPAAIGNGTYMDLAANFDESDYYSVCIAPGDDLSITLNARLFQNSHHIGLHDANWAPCETNLTASLLAESNNESLSYQNTSTEPLDVLIAVRPAWWFWGCTRYDLTVSGANGCNGWPTVSTFCDPMDVNSTGVPTVLTATTGTGIHSGLRLEASQGPPDQFGMVLIGTGATSPGLSLGQGRLCLDTQSGNRFGRYNVAGTIMNSTGRFDSNGVLQNLTGTSVTGSGFDVPKLIPSINQVLRSGETWHFQLWHREPNAGSNFSNGVTVMFQNLPN